MYSLVGTDGTRYFTFELKPGSYLVGRKVDCDFPVPNQTVSRQHARIDVDSSGEQIHLTDLGSRNGTMVNSRRVVDRVQLQPGDQIELGSTQFRLTAEGDTSSGLGRPITTKLADQEPEKSVFLSLNEAQKPLPSHVSQRPELFPTLSEMARLLVHTEPRSTMLERSLELVARMIPADRLAVLTTPEDESDVITAASLSPGNKDLGSFTLSRTIVQKIMEEKTSILIGDPSQDDRFAQQESIIMSDMKSAMAVPLFDSGEVLGILYADTTNPLHQYNDEYLRLLAVFGNIIAARLLNYQLIEQREERRVIDAELRRAEGIQQKLLTVEQPGMPGYSLAASLDSSRSVGGDLYDMQFLPDGRLLVLLADVSGKGLGAALLMSQILGSFRVLCKQQPFSLLEVVEKVSNQLFHFSDPEDFATLFAAVVNPADGTMVYINAGHNPPLLVRENGTIDKLEPSGTMIGAFDINTWSESSTTLDRGDLLFVFTDGVTEAQGPQGLFGDERTEKIAVELRDSPPDEIVQEIRKRLDTFAEDVPQSDDITMLMVKRDA
jgi:serine phosphatase RsbU (regulator of sigma subunit)